MYSNIFVPAKNHARHLKQEIQVSNIRVSKVGSQVVLKLDIHWEGSWRSEPGVPPENWDAAWVFVKMSSDKMKQRVAGYVPGTWGPAYFDANPALHSGPPEAMVVPSEDSMGVFVYRKNPGVGTVTFKGIELAIKENTSEWIECCEQVYVAVFALWMVYIPKDSFWIGDPQGADGPSNCFYDPQASGDNKAYQVTSENAIEVGSDAELYYSNSGFGGDRRGPIPAEFPKGHEAFYIMRNHVTQAAYARFINLITSAAKTERYPYLGEGAFRFTIFTDSLGLRTATRGLRPVNYLSWTDGAAFTSWAGLRPITEFEFTKCCRGPALPVADEYAWGNTFIETAHVIVGEETAAAYISGNCNINNTQSPFDGGDGGQGPVRDDLLLVAGAPDDFSTFKVNTESIVRLEEDLRMLSGASYYGVMGLSGNLWEYCITVGKKEGRAFTGIHGNGQLNVLGLPRFQEFKWPGINANGVGYRGGSWYTATSKGRVADRSNGGGVPGYVFRSHDTGFRCARTAPKINSDSSA